MALFVVPAVIGVIIFAPIGLRIFGASYSESGSSLLRLLCLAAIANIPVAVAIGMLRARRQVARLFGFYAIRTLLIGSLCVVFVKAYGLNGIGWGWVVGEWTLAAGLGVFYLRDVFAELIRRSPEPVTAGS